jgi:hypothetical protein
VTLPPTIPITPLGPEDAYASDAELVAVIGPSANSATVERRAVALLLATRWVAYRIGVPVTDDPVDVDVPPTIHAVPATAAVRQATLAAAVRFYKSPDVPWGVAGGWDEAVYVRQSMPEVELILFGQRRRWGIA